MPVNICTRCGEQFSAKRSRVKTCHDCRARVTYTPASEKSDNCRSCGCKIVSGLPRPVCGRCTLAEAQVDEQRRLKVVERAVSYRLWMPAQTISKRLADEDSTHLASDLRALAARGLLRRAFFGTDAHYRRVA